MPRCENEKCAKELTPDEVSAGADDKLYCLPCADESSLVLGREFDYSVSYTRERGLRAGMRLGGASVSFEVNPDELDRTFGPAR